MPELPEVETVRRTLVQLVLNKTIKDVDVFWPNIIKKPADIEQFKHLLLGQTIHDIDRRGKFLKFMLDDYVLLSHLRMEGRYVFQKADEIEDHDKHTHVIFSFTDGSRLLYRDVRKFGTMHIFTKGEEEKSKPLAQLGLEPFSDKFTEEHLYKGLKKTERSIKVALLDQQIVVGLGNIYVDEALFKANIHPMRKAATIKKREIGPLHKAVVQTLQEAVDRGGSTIRSYVNSQGEMGMFQLQLNVYAQNGKPCPNCGHEIEKTVVGGRGTHYCPKCQKI
ncbi:DNA-formamidopyrimidine glycosylase [Lottiidibacillus patelloidae]|uniref:Formamidopyrimidine-DNA glycosylase n=1 Tax=Lottiidibacillus patelloidae TaxID=2670334 RepID=A0A263BW51_9BACI|nr:DNA-formamidopyrimidine glycosylase [Lottiidibacillus patelloidae]OZM57944.1 DNA-formamidopyrimidine glycosylase [Lottiidibacillus patelloidae]